MKSYDDRNSYNNRNDDDDNDDNDNYTSICKEDDVNVELPLNLFHHFNSVFNSDTFNEKKSSLLDHTYYQSSTTYTNTNTNNYNNNNTTTTVRFNWEAPIIQKDGMIVNKPILFHNHIKSSGYGQVPNDLYERKKLLLAAKKKKQLQQQQQKQKLQQQQQHLKQRQEHEQLLFKDNDNDMDVKNMRSLSAPPSRNISDDHNINDDVYDVHHDNTINNNINMNSNDHDKSSAFPAVKVVSSKGPRIRQYPTDSSLIDTYMHGHDYPYPSSISKSSLLLSSSSTQLPPIQQIKYSDDGTLLGITTNDSVAIALKIPTSRFKGDVMSFVGNNK
jgi:hypothetical protein